MKDAQYATDKSAVVHRTLSLLVFVAILVFAALDGPGFVTFRGVAGSLFALMLIWFPDLFAEHTTGGNTGKYYRVFGWVLLVGVPLWFHGLSWITN